MIVEDEPLVSDFVAGVIGLMGHEAAAIARNGADALKAADNQPIDLAIMDIDLGKGVDGIETARQLAKRGIQALFLTAYGDIKTLQDALKIKPLGYVIKPADEADIRAAVATALAQVQPKTQTEDLLFLDNHIVYNPENKQLTTPEGTLQLGKKESRFLEILIQNRGHTLPYDQVEWHVWENELPLETTRRTLFWRLKQKLGGDLLEAVAGMGYRLKNTTDVKQM